MLISTCIVSAVRLGYVVQTYDTKDYTWTTVDSLKWTAVELFWYFALEESLQIGANDSQLYYIRLSSNFPTPHSIRDQHHFG